jgi:hypothetical protein
MKIISVIEKNAGFYSTFFYMHYHYLVAKCNGSFELRSDHWMYKFEKGWEDYFENIDFSVPGETEELVLRHMEEFSTAQFRLITYKNALPDIYRYNARTRGKIDEVRQQLQLPEGYDAIYIRRGDKLLEESVLIETSRYANVLLMKHPQCHTIFLQTDDFNAFLELKAYVAKWNITVVTLCPDTQMGGMVVFDTGLSMHQNPNMESNVAYMKTHEHSLKACKPVNTMTPDEVHNHTMELIVSVDMVKHSHVCVCDYQSNVSRFIKLFHNNLEAVVDVLDPDTEIDMNQFAMPARNRFR